MTTAQELRDKKQTYWDDVAVGHQFPPLVIGPMTPTHLFRWSAAIENWHRCVRTDQLAVTAPDIATPLIFNIEIVSGTASGTITSTSGVTSSCSTLIVQG